ncbi:MAG: hypothetical protein WDW36_000465 [Sanguina aurantia]
MLPQKTLALWLDHGCSSSKSAEVATDAPVHKIVAVEEAHSAPPARAAAHPSAAAPAKEGPDWVKIRSTLGALGEKTPEALAARQKLFSRMDMGGNNVLSLAEIDKGLRDDMGMDDIFDAKPAIMRAFQAAKGAGGKEGNPDYVDRREFRLLMVYLLQYFQLFEVFDELTQEDGNRFNYEEFKKGITHLKIHLDDPKAEFDSMVEAGGHVLFTDFCNWALKKNLGGEEGE